MQKLLAIDLDGTLFYPKQLRRRIPKKNVEFLRSWIDAGNKVVLISSRSYYFTEQLKKEIQRPVDFINFLGGQIRVNDEIVVDKPLNSETLGKILDEIRSNYDTLGFLLNSEKYPAVLRNNSIGSKLFLKFYSVWYKFQGQYREDYFLDNDIFDEEVKNGKVYIVRVLLGVRKKQNKNAKELNKTLREKYPEIECSWTSIISELTSQGSNKADSLSCYIDIINCPKENVYVIGDSGNDIEMFKKFYENSYCMGHASPSVKKYAKNIIMRVHNLKKILLKGEN